MHKTKHYFVLSLLLSSSYICNAEKKTSIVKTEDATTLVLGFETPPERVKKNNKSIQVDLMLIKGGIFTMGSNLPEEKDEYPAHEVKLSDFYISKTEVTQELWYSVMGSNPSNFKGDKLPVELESWHDTQLFIEKLNRITGKNYRLPTEAEWEFAAGGGNSDRNSKYAGTENDNELNDFAWYGDNSNSTTHEVASKKPNPVGLYDMSGNVWEWCSDWFGPYSSETQTNPKGPTTGTMRVRRGGSWFVSANNCRITNRNGRSDPNLRKSGIGFRLAHSVK